jgi:FkbM family methyltransferase
MKVTDKEFPEHRLNEYIKSSNEDFFVLQIGANDGKMADPIYNKVKSYKWQGLFVEPVTYLFNRLKQNYQGCDTLKFENSVIAKHTGEIDFFQFPEEFEDNTEFPFWASGMGSVLEPFDSPGHKNVKSKNFEMVKKKTSCLTFTDLLNKHNVKRIDLLQIDTEGFDGEIICSIDFSRIRPKYIRYEEKHIQRVFDQNMTSVSSQNVTDYLRKHGYITGGVTNGFDRVSISFELL